jgi:hypothetical protein
MSDKLKSRIVGKTYSISVAVSTPIFQKYQIESHDINLVLDLYRHVPAGI